MTIQTIPISKATGILLDFVPDALETNVLGFQVAEVPNKNGRAVAISDYIVIVDGEHGPDFEEVEGLPNYISGHRVPRDFKKVDGYAISLWYVPQPKEEPNPLLKDLYNVGCPNCPYPAEYACEDCDVYKANN